MEIKKYPKFQLENYSKIFLQIGLTLALFIVYQFIEYKTYEKIVIKDLSEVNVVIEMTEDIPIVETIKIKPTQSLAPPPPSIEKIKVVDDDKVIEEAVIESTETNQDEAVTNAVITTDDITEVAESEEVVEDVPFLLIEDVPIFPGCKGNNKELKDCFTQKVTEFFGKKFDVNLATELGLEAGKKKLFVVFTIDKSGKITNVNARGPHPVLEKEVFKIISSLPKMTPGKQRGMPVGVSYSIPITFEVRRN